MENFSCSTLLYNYLASVINVDSLGAGFLAQTNAVERIPISYFSDFSDFSESQEILVVSSSPKFSYLPSGVTFAGWRVGTPASLGISSYWVQSSETVLAPGTPYTVNADVSLTARYNGLEICLSDSADNSEILYINNGKPHTLTL